MRWQMVVLVIMGLAAALAASVLVAASGAKGDRANKPVVEEISMLVASGPIAATTVIDASHITVKKLSKKQAPKEYFEDPVQVIGQVVTVPLVEGQALIKSCFAPDGSGYHIASTLPEGMRAMSISLRDHSRLDGILYPGSIVDVLATFTLPSEMMSSKKDIVSVTLLKTVQVLAVEDRTVASTEEEKEDKHSNSSQLMKRVTLMVTARQAEALQLAMENGELSLVLRNPRDTEEVAGKVTRLSDLSPELTKLLAPEPKPEPKPEPVVAKAEEPKPAPIPAPAPVVQAKPEEVRPAWTTVVIKGGTSAVQKFDSEELPEPQSATPGR